MKTCSKCKQDKDVSFFTKNNQRKDGLSCQCKTCLNHKRMEYRDKSKDRIKAQKARSYAKNKEKILAKQAIYYIENKSKISETIAKYHAANSNRIAEQRAIYRANNKDKIAAANALYRAENPEKIKCRHAKWRAENPSKHRSNGARWEAMNPEKCRIKCHNRRARLRDVGGVLSKDIASKLIVLQKGKCACGCKQPLGDNYHLDHIMPIALGGSNTDDNIQLLRQRCNNQKHAKHPIDFMQSKGFLL